MSSRNDRPPQTAGEALSYGWTYLSLRCAICRHVGRIELASRPGNELIASIVQRALCPCGRKGSELIDVKIGMKHVSEHEMPIAFEGTRTRRVGMN